MNLDRDHQRHEIIYCLIEQCYIHTRIIRDFEKECVSLGSSGYLCFQIFKNSLRKTIEEIMNEVLEEENK
jgi:hypothetical protein